MKKILISMLAIVGSLSVLGQSNSEYDPSSDPIGNAYNLWAAKSTGDQPRLLSEVRLKFDGINYSLLDGTDSTAYYYSGSRGYWNNGGEFEFWKYDVGESYQYNGTSGTYMPGNEKLLSTYDVADRLLERVLQLRIGASPDFENRQRTLYSYNTANNIDTQTVQSWDYPTGTWINSSGTRLIFTYTSDSKYASIIYQWYNSTSSVFQNVRLYAYTYDGTGKLTHIETKKWDTSSGGMWVDNLRATCTYGGSGNMLSKEEEQWDVVTGLWKNYSQTTYSDFVDYKPGLTFRKSWDVATAMYVGVSKIRKIYNGDGQVVFEYRQYSPGDGLWHFSNTATQYYYETPAGVNIASKADDGISVFPVPATDEIHVKVDWSHSQAFDISIVDMSGSVSCTRHVAECRSYKGAFITTDLPPGNYIVRIDGETDCIVKRVTIMR